jgi:hypothetical protein
VQLLLAPQEVSVPDIPHEARRGSLEMGMDKPHLPFHIALSMQRQSDRLAGEILVGVVRKLFGSGGARDASCFRITHAN